MMGLPARLLGLELNDLQPIQRSTQLILRFPGFQVPARGKMPQCSESGREKFVLYGHTKHGGCCIFCRGFWHKHITTMATDIPTCSCPGCDQPGTSKCSACKTTPYCGPICQTVHWAHHKEECDGHLLKVGKAHFAKANGFDAANNHVQTLRYIDLALAKFNAMKKRPLEVISEALAIKCGALQEMGRFADALQCSKDKYNMWAMARGPAHPSTIEAAFYLIEDLLHNNEYEDAHLFAHTLWEIIHTNNHVDNDIPGDEREEYVATAAYLLSRATYRLAASGGIPPEEKQKAGEEAIARARQSLEIRTLQCGAESDLSAIAMVNLAEILNYFNDADDENEVLRLFEQSNSIFIRVHGRLSMNVSLGEGKLANVYEKKAKRVLAANNFHQCMANLELALSHYREAERIYRAINQVHDANAASRNVIAIEEQMRLVTAARAASRG